MPNCSVVNCKNGTSKGFRLFRLPSADRNAERRQLWFTIIAKPNLHQNARICESHFSNDQFENRRMDGKKRLRPDAFPDLLQVHNTEVSESNKRKRIEEVILPEYSNCVNIENTILEDPINDPLRNCTIVEDSLENTTYVTENLKRNLKSALRKCRNYAERLEKRNPTNLEKIFNRDQLEYLETDKRKGTTWSDDTITKALKLYFACGTEGYNEILNQNLPYPSIRTLQDRLKNLKFNAVILKEYEKPGLQ